METSTVHSISRASEQTSTPDPVQITSRKLTKRVIETLPSDPGGREAFVWDGGDGGLKGFGVRIAPGGTKSYMVFTAPRKAARAGW
jgi:hypothetical protein